MTTNPNISTEIVQREGPILKEVCLPVSEKEIDTTAFRKILDRMQSILETQKDGVALAAPQIGINKRIFVVSPRAFEIINAEKETTDPEGKSIKPKKEHLIYINPEISKLSRQKKLLEEGCLSVRYAYGKVYRHERATVTALDEKGQRFTRGAGGILAQIFQHETDHLNGHLFIEKAEELEEVTPEQYEKMMAEA